MIPFVETEKIEYEYFGLKMQQNNHALSVLAYLLNKVKPSQIIEFGTRTGGLSLLLQLYSIHNNGKFVTFDFDDKEYIPKYKTLFSQLNIDFRKDDIFKQETIDEIGSLIKGNTGTSLILCDATKAGEFNTYAPFIKYGDIIGCHDYFDTYEDFVQARNEQIWFWHECKLSEIQQTVSKYSLFPFMYKETKNIAWKFFTK